MTGAKPAYEIYDDVQCPRCGYSECRDTGPYTDYWPGIDEQLPPVDDGIHYLVCGRCGKGFDAVDDDAPIIARRAAWVKARHDGGSHHGCDPAACAWAAMGIWESAAP